MANKNKKVARFDESVALTGGNDPSASAALAVLRRSRKSFGVDSTIVNEKLLRKLETSNQLDDSCYEVAEEHLKDNLVGGGMRSLWRTDADDFGEWGVGVQLYFEFTFRFAVFSTLIGVVYLVLWSLCVTGDALNYLDDTAIGNTQVIASRMSVGNIGQRALFASNASNTSLWIRSEKVIGVFDEEWRIKDVSLIAGISDALCAVLILIFLWHFEFLHIPKIVSRHREELVTPDIYTVFVDHLPRRLYGGGGQDSYGDRLKHHFELILAALVHPKNVYKGMVVLDANDEGLPLEERVYTSFCCCCVRRAPGIDRNGRRIGHIVKVSGKSCLVKWVDTAHAPGGDENMKYKYGSEDLIDARLLWKLEMHGIDRVPLPKNTDLSPRLKKDEPSPRLKKNQTDDTKLKNFGSSNSHTKNDLQSAADDWDSVIYSVALVRDFDNRLSKMKREARDEERNFEEKIRKQQEAGNTMKAMKTFNAKYNADDDFENDVQIEDRDIVGAFITFEHTNHRDFIHSEFRFSRTLLRAFVTTPYCSFGDAHIRVTEAQVPSDVYWDNLDFPKGKRLRRRLYVLGFSLLLILGLILAIGFARTAAEDANAAAYSNDMCDESSEEPADCICIRTGIQNVWLDDPPGIYEQCDDWASKVAVAKLWGGLSSFVAVVAIIVGGFVVEPLCHFERAKSVTSMNRKIMSITSVVYILALGIIRLFSNAKWPVSILGLLGAGTYEELTPDWYLRVGGSIIITLAINTFYPIVGILQGPVFKLWVRCRKKKQLLFTDLVSLYTPPLFPFALRHAEQMSSFYALLLFCGGMPILGMLMPLNFIFFYAVDKYTFLRASRVPPRYTHHLIKRQVQWAQFGVWCHAMFSIFVYSNDDSLPSHCTQCTAEDEFLGIKPSADSGIQEFLGKCLVSSALPNAIVGFIVMMSWFLRVAYFVLGRNPLARSLLKKGLDHMKYESSIGELHLDDAFHSEVRAMKRKGLESSYDVQEMPGYEFLKPAQDSKPAAKLLGVALGLHGLADTVTGVPSTKDNMKSAVDKIKQQGFGGDLIIDGDKPDVNIDIDANGQKKAPQKAGRLISKVRSSPVPSSQYPSGDSIIPNNRSSEPAIAPKAKAKGKGRGKGKRKGSAPPRINDPEHDLHLEDLAQARLNLGIGTAKGKPTSVRLGVAVNANDEIDDALGLKDDNLNVRAKTKGKTKGKGKGKGRPQMANGSNALNFQIAPEANWSNAPSLQMTPEIQYRRKPNPQNVDTRTAVTSPRQNNVGTLAPAPYSASQASRPLIGSPQSDIDEIF